MGLGGNLKGGGGKIMICLVGKIKEDVEEVGKKVIDKG